MEKKMENKSCCGRPMNFGGLFFGFMAVFFGLFFLVNNLGFLNIGFPALTIDELWPLFLVFIGLSAITVKNIFVKILGVLLTLIIAALCIVLILYRPALEYSPLSTLNGMQGDSILEFVGPLEL